MHSVAPGNASMSGDSIGNSMPPQEFLLRKLGKEKYGCYIFFNSISLKTRIIGSVMLLATIGIVALAVNLSRSLRNDVEALLTTQLNSMVSYVSGDIDRKIGLRLGVMTELAHTLGVEGLPVQKRTQVLLSQRQSLTALFPYGGGIVDRHGKIIAEFGQTTSGLLNSTIKDVEYNFKAIAGCKAYVAPPDISHTAPLIGLTAPICSSSGEVIGAVVGIVSLSDRDLFGQLEQTHAAAGSYLLLVSRSAQVVVSANDKGRILKKVDESIPLIKRRLQEGFEGPGIATNSKGIEVFSISKNLEKTDWFVVAMVPTKLAFKPVTRFQLQISAAALVMIAVMSLLLFALLERLLAPLQSAGRAMQRMTDGTEPLSSLKIVRKDEIGRLIHHFNKLVAERKVTEERLEYLSQHDALTGLPNRLQTQGRIAYELAYAEGHGLQVGLLYLDLDNFKTINDSLGHAAGDEIIKLVATRLREAINNVHIVSRLDGDEFLAVLRNVTGTEEIESIMNGILERFTQPLLFEGHEISTTMSIGAAVFPEDGSNFTALCKKADTAMVQAKEAGRNTFRFFDPRMNVDTVDRLMLRGQMKRALQRNEFVLYYQPQIDLDTGAVIGAEALIRWQHPELGLLSPGLFIPMAEDSGLIVPMGDWIIQEACRQAAEWQRNGLPTLVVAVNLSAVQFRRGSLEPTLIEALTVSGLAPEYLELELTESLLIDDIDNVLQRLKRLKNLGVKLSIDDFGTGYSSLSYLKKFDVDKIKIDQSFVRDLVSDSDSTAIVKAIIQMARGLDLRTIAEGVENERTLDHLRLLHCNEAQGYHFAKPMPPAKFAMFLEAAADAGHAGISTIF